MTSFPWSHRPSRWQGWPLLALLAGAVACIPSMRSSYREGSELMETTVDARDLAAVRIDADVGDAELRAAPGDSVRVNVVLRSSDAERLARECIPKSSLDARREGGVLYLRVDQRTRNRCGTRWRVELPPRLHARVRADVGDVTIHGLTGGLDVETENGDVDVTSPAGDHGHIAVSSDVGSVRVCLRGYEVPPADRRGAGAAVELRREVGPAVLLRTHVGDASLRLEGDAPGEGCGGSPSRERPAP